jgi:hypothetical protein
MACGTEPGQFLKTIAGPDLIQGRGQIVAEKVLDLLFDIGFITASARPEYGQCWA